jgi:hypothetical protein
MPLTTSFSVGQPAATPNLIVVTDTSTGSDINVTQRRVYVQTATGSYLVPSGVTTDYTPWSYSDISISLDVLTTDSAVNILVQWMDVSNNILYTENNNYAFTQYNRQFFVYLVQSQGLTPGIVQDVNYFSNSAVLWTMIQAAINAVEYGNNIAAAQNCLNIANNLRLNQNFSF